ncbi:MAG: cupin domain-containing protein [Chloroflexi bacterium]|nr:cupin domain-containing protein [Chloroflexota bacterium]
MDVPRRVPKPWGYELIWAETGRYAAKILHVEEGHQLSLQYHRAKDETIHVQRGTLLLLVDEGEGLTERRLGPGESYHIAPGIRHRLRAESDCDVLEASTPELGDVVRLEDAYGREGTSAP